MFVLNLNRTFRTFSEPEGSGRLRSRSTPLVSLADSSDDVSLTAGMEKERQPCFLRVLYCLSTKPN